MDSKRQNQVLAGIAAVVLLVIGAVVWRSTHREGRAGSPASEFEKKWQFTAGPL